MRITREQALMGAAQLISLRSTCLRKQVGAVVAHEGRILSWGYSSSPSGLPHCLELGCLIGIPDEGCLRTQHAEANAIAWAARKGIGLEGSDLYTTLAPCLSCSKLIINSGIHRVFFLEPYRKTEGSLLLQASGITVDAFHEPRMSIVPPECDCAHHLHSRGGGS